MPVLVADNLQKTYVSGETRVTALAGVSFAIEAGDFVALMGPSGSGKSTLLSILGLLDTPTQGSYRLAGVSTGELTSRERNVLERLFGG